MAFERDDEFDIAEEVARGLAQRSGDSSLPCEVDVDVGVERMLDFQSPFCGPVPNGSYHNYVTSNGFENAQPTPFPTSPSMASSVLTHPYQYGHGMMNSPRAKRSSVGRKPPKGPDGIRRYSSRRATVERRDRINSRERDRMHQLCDAFERLRQVLPFKRPKQGAHRQKLSKISTLLLAQNYIRALEEMLEQPPGQDVSAVSTTCSGFPVSSTSSAAHFDLRDPSGHFPSEYYPCEEVNGYERRVGSQNGYGVEHGFGECQQEFYRVNSAQYHYL
ncbi:uncharacterized protein [Diadema antillarum]|uniref:uncharacterized protein n=1 Tax=Diadema antillarum TaxID=105358 RepID=UPI003A83D138